MIKKKTQELVKVEPQAAPAAAPAPAATPIAPIETAKPGAESAPNSTEGETTLKKAKKTLRGIQFINTNSTWQDLSMLLYGPPGQGKTHLAGTAVEVEQMREVLFIDNDGGTRTLIGNPRFPGIQIIRPESYPDYNPIMNWLTGGRGPGVDVFYDNLGDPKKYKTVVVDNLGAWHNMIIQHILSTENFNRHHKDLPTQTDYRLAIAWIMQTLKLLRQYSQKAGVNIILTAHVTGITDSENNLLQRVPMIPGKLATTVPGDMPLVGYLVAEGAPVRIGARSNNASITYKAYFAPFDKYTVVKDQSTKKLGMLVDPSMSKIYNLVVNS